MRVYMLELNSQTLRKNLAAYLELHAVNELEFLLIQHPLVKAIISLQGAQLLSWQAQGKEVLWLSDIEPFVQGKAIRGGIPLSYPWFNKNGTPSHGYARINPWQLESYQMDEQQVELSLVLNYAQELKARVVFTFSEKLKLEFYQLAQEQAQVALHSYYRLGSLAQAQVLNLPPQALDHLQDKQISVDSPLQITQAFDAEFKLTPFTQEQIIVDPSLQRKLKIKHDRASEVVVWNPGQATPQDMRASEHQHMLCLETARLSELLKQGESFAVEIESSHFA
ncbi:D-hexose-6-phosphate mutarotase [Psittacicella gerlachiana]|uniref:Putative glucose-6-phosphate 1-epimerase n=1 Tax=Psittacicella gerlachiana TaxID=2028574 RepID=A0A3A1YGW6_9GAMM|nr:D-hexose-6-phosphate mutarotase [Psittacicella gerlachiana]RIY35464.1 hypothetical protein CKF59_03640 [Psittacicella gerlachiana]